MIVFTIFLTVVLNKPNNASYIREKNRPLNIAHRGLSSILP